MIGPELPPHLQKQASAYEEDEEEDVGPIPGPSIAGPQRPPELQSKSTTEPEDVDENDYAPSLPPDLLASRNVAASAAPPKRVLGPAMLIANSYDDSDDDDFGPKPLPAYAQSRQHEPDGVKQFMEQEERRRKQIEEASKVKTVQRDEWMLRPPTSSELLANLDPTKLNRPRQFGRSAAPAAKNTESNLWTETPAERQQRLADEVSGKRKRVANAEDTVTPEEALEARKKQRRDERIRKGVDEHTRKVRGGALVEEHTKALASKPGEDEADKGIWDHSRDMSLGGRLMDDGQRKKFLRDAKGLGDRFGTSSSGGFL